MKSPRSTGSFNEIRSISGNGSPSDWTPFEGPLATLTSVEVCGVGFSRCIKACDTEETTSVDLIDRMNDNRRVGRREERNGVTLPCNGVEEEFRTGPLPAEAIKPLPKENGPENTMVWQIDKERHTPLCRFTSSGERVFERSSPV